MGTSKKIRRYDYGMLQKVERTPAGFLRVPGFATRVGVFTYRDANGELRRELRHPDDVFHDASLSTLRNCPVTLQHPPEMLNPENVSEYIKGYVGDRVEVLQDKIECDFLIIDKDAIDAIENGGMRETSSGYLADLEPEEGIFNGVPYNFRQKNIQYNHVALVDRGRAGPEVRLRLDSADAVMEPEMATAKQEEHVMMKKLMIGGQEVELPAEAAAIVEAMMDRYDEMKAKVDQMQLGQAPGVTEPAKKGDVEVNQSGISAQPAVEQMAPDGREATKKPGAGDMEGPARAAGVTDMEEGGGVMDPVEDLKRALEAERAKVDGLQAKLDELTAGPAKKKMDADDFVKAVRRRSLLERQAATLLPEEKVAKFDSMSDDEIRAAVIAQRDPKARLEGKSTTYLEVRFDSIMENVAVAQESNRKMGETLLKRRTSRWDGDESSPEAARAKALDESRNAWKTDLTAVRK